VYQVVRLCRDAMRGSSSVALVLVVTIATNLLVGLVPIPGGFGIAEAVMISWLVLVGVPEEAAFAATIVYRLWTSTSRNRGVPRDAVAGAARLHIVVHRSAFQPGSPKMPPLH
jgi:hypothetical protein